MSEMASAPAVDRRLCLPRASFRDIRRVRKDYQRAFGRYPNLLRPRSFSEKMQWRKLFDLNPLYVILSDKLASREYVAARVGPEFLPPLLWTGDDADAVPFDALDPPYIVKCSHGSGFNVVVTDRTGLDAAEVRSKLRRHLGRNFGQAMREPGYAPVRPRLLVERLLMQPDGSPPNEPKLFAFDGRVRVVHTIVVGPDRSRRDAVYDPDWNYLGWHVVNDRYDRPLQRPERLAEMIAVAERIAQGFDHLRVDLYDWAGGVRVGELTLYNLSGLARFHPEEVDLTMGSWWRLPRPARRAFASMLPW